jgi:MFS family permease
MAGTAAGGSLATAGPLPALRFPAYRWFLTGIFLSNLGSWMASTSQGWLVLDLTDSEALLGLVSAAAAAPILLLSLWAGVLADRVDRRKLLVGSQVAGGMLMGVLAVLVTTGLVEYWQILLIAFAVGSCIALGNPAFQAVVPSLVDRAAVGNAVALNSAQFNLARIVGPVVAGIVIALGGTAFGFWANAAMVLVLAAIVWRLPVGRSGTETAAQASLWSNLMDGIRYVLGTRPLSTLVLLAAAPTLFVLPYIALLPVYARDILDIGAPGLGLLSGAIGIGALVGAIAVAVTRPRRSGRLLVAGLATAGVGVAVFGVSTSLPVSLAALVAVGAAQVAYFATTMTLIQALSPGRLRGRVMSLYILTSWGVLPIGNVVAGVVAEQAGAWIALVGGGVLTLLVLALTLVARPELGSITLGADGRVVVPVLKPSPARQPQEG